MPLNQQAQKGVTEPALLLHKEVKGGVSNVKDPLGCLSVFPYSVIKLHQLS